MTIIEIIGAVTGTGILGFLFGYKKNKAETKVVESDAIAGIQRAYTQLINDYNLRFTELEKEIEQLRQDLKACQETHLQNRK